MREKAMVGTTYEVRIAGRVSDQVLHELGDVSTSVEGARTLVTCSFTDQAELQGFLQRLRAFGLELVELRAVPFADDERPVDPETAS
jgi:hypothetical protein